ncbi:YoaK family protein [Bosea sp. LjRoot90]|uniref:YoaK family protein n=1 Tax=Bosea sp. LjRoot90 TaxID=3342342 RepID=UPI003ED10614
MLRYDRPAIGLAIGLSGLAGFVDALGFLNIGGFFVSFMTGNTTRLGIELVEGRIGGIMLAGMIILLFVFGVVCGSLAGHVGGHRRQAAVLAFVTLALALSAGLYSIGLGIAAAGILALAMGAENAVFQRDGEVTIGLTYMTGTLVKMGQRLAGALLGRPKLAFLRHFVLWLSLLCGALLGAYAHRLVGLGAIWLAATAAGVFAILALVMPDQD